MPRTKSKPKRRSKREKCLCCPNKAQSRGLCWTCHAAAKGAIRRGQATEQELIEKGLMLPLQRTGRPPKSGFSDALSKSSNP